MAGRGTYRPFVTPNLNTNRVNLKPATSNSGPQQNGGAVNLPGGNPGPVNTPDPIVSTVVVAPTGILTVTQATDSASPPNQVTLTFTNQPINLVFASPASGAAGAPGFRQIVPADIANQLSNTVCAGPATGTSGAVTFRALVPLDIPELPHYEVYLPVGSAVLITSATPTNVLSLTLPAGDWYVEANCNMAFTFCTESSPGSIAGLSATSATLPTDGSEVYASANTRALDTWNNSLSCPRKRFALPSGGTVYLVLTDTYVGGPLGGGGTGSMSAFGGLTAVRA